MKIESLQNPRIKNLLKLQEKSRERKKQGLFLVEGLQENELAIKGGYKPIEYYICPEIYNDELYLPNAAQYQISESIFEKIAYRKTSGGIIGVYVQKTTTVNDIRLDKMPLIIVLESVEKPGNLGAILRTSDAVDATAVIVCDPNADFYNPNVIRSSVGTVFTNQIAVIEKTELVEWLHENRIQIYSTFLREYTKNIYDVSFKFPTAIVLGTEATGLSDFWLGHSDKLIKIPMNGVVDSLNVSNAAAICIFEAYRQRR